MAYEAKALFPQIQDFRSYREQRAYVMRTLVDLAKRKALYCTDLVNQPGTKQQREFIRNLAAECIYGIDHGPDLHERQGRPIPRELLDYKVRIVSIPCRIQVDEEIGAGAIAVSYKTDKLPIRFCAGYVTKSQDPSKAEAMAMGMAVATDGTERLEPDIVETESFDTQLYLIDAWKCLHQHGEHFALAPSRRVQAVTWRYREVRPGDQSTKADAEAPKRRGRKPAGYTDVGVQAAP